MKVTILCVALAVCSVVSAPTPQEDDKPEVQIIKNEFNNRGNKGYDYAIESSDGSKQSQKAVFKHVGGLVVTGSYEIVDDEGVVHRTKYIADEKGYRIIE